MFQQAERKQAKLKMAISGPSGSGKTMTSLLIASGLCPNGRIALIDTENHSASLYAGLKNIPKFDVDELDPPYSTEKYIQSINEAVKAGYDVLVIDSLSHQWAGEGGLLQKKTQLDARGGNSYANWAKMTPEHEKFKSALLHADIHIIGTLRSKQAHAITPDANGKTRVEKLGLEPVQREGFEYEFTLVFDMDMSHQASASKDRTSLFHGKLFVPTVETGKQLSTWISHGVVESPGKASTSASQRDYIFTWGIYQGNKLSELDEITMKDYSNYLVKKAKTDKVGVDQNVLALIEAVKERWG